MYSTTDFRKGLKIVFEGDPFIIVDFQHVKPGKGHAFVRTRLKNMVSGAILERTFRTTDKIEPAFVEERRMQFLYSESSGTSGSPNNYHFMDTQTYEQMVISGDLISDAKDFMIENLEVNLLLFKGKPVDVNLPNFIEIKVTKTEPGFRGDTASNTTKPATLETGATIQVPLFVNEGDLIKVDTRTKEYMTRV